MMETTSPEAAGPVAQGRYLVLKVELGAAMAHGGVRSHHTSHISSEQLVEEMNASLSMPGVSNAWTMPIKARIDMLTTGVRTPVGIKVYGSDLKQIEKIGTDIEGILPKVRGTRNVFAERTGGGYFLDFDWKREEMARYGLSMEDVQAVLMSAVGGENVTTTIEGRERYPSM